MDPNLNTKARLLTEVVEEKEEADSSLSETSFKSILSKDKLSISKSFIGHGPELDSESGM